jgi:hypothetical protein
MPIASLVFVMLVFVTVLIPVIHTAVLALSFNLPSTILDVSPVLSMTINLVLKVLLGFPNALFAIATFIGE